MDYRAFIKKQLMGGKMTRVRGFGLSGGSLPKMQLSNDYSGGTIAHRAVVGPLIPNFEGLSITKKKSGSGRNRKIYADEPVVKGSGKKFNSLKFNF